MVNNLFANSGDIRGSGSIPRMGRSPAGGICYPLQYSWAQSIENPPAMQEIQVQSLGREDPLEEGMATHSNIPAWEIPWTEEPGGLQSMGLQTVRHDLATKQ